MRWVGDKNCDTVCMDEACRFDGGDCDNVPTAAPVRVCSCPLLWLGDKDCNIECNNAECNFDNGDCALTDAPMVLAPPPSSLPTMSPTVTTVEEPKRCASACEPSMLGDGQCQMKCNFAECMYDNGDCAQSASWCAPGCVPSIQGDGFCDSACNVAKCNFDNHDCQAAVDPLQARLVEGRIAVISA